MKTTHRLLTLTCIFLAVTAHSTPLQIDTPSTVTITGRLMSPSGGWNWTMSRAGVITVKDSTGATVAEKIWNDFNSANASTYAARDTSVTNATVSTILTFTLSLDAGTYDLNALGSYSQAASGYLWIDLATEVTPTTPSETWSPFDELLRDWYDLGEWTPDASTILTGQQFTQTKQQAQDWRKGERSNLNHERNVVNYQRSQQLTQTATGTKPKTVPVISWAAPSAITYGTPLSGAQLNATASVPGTFVYAPDVNTVLNAGTDQQLTAYFTPEDGETYASATASQTISVNRADTTLTVISPTSPATLAIDSAAAITLRLARTNGNATLSTASVTYSKGTTSGTADGILSLNTFTMTQGGGNDTITVNLNFPGDANHNASNTSVTFRVPVPGSVALSAATSLVSPITLPSAYLYSEHGQTTTSLDFQVSNPGELPVEVVSSTFTPQLGSVASFTLADATDKTVSVPLTLAAGQKRNLRVKFRPARYATNRDEMRLTWRCRPNLTVVNSGQVDWTLEGQGLKPIMATVPYGSTPDATNARDLSARWPALRTQ